MKYKYMGSEMAVPCTPPGRSILETRSCREINKCTRECWPKKLECQMCGSMNSVLSVLEEIDSGEHISVCSKCRKTLEEENHG